MKKRRRMFSFSLACIMIISFVFANVYAEDISNKAQGKDTKGTVGAIVRPVPGLSIDKTVKNVVDFDNQNPEYQLDLTAKVQSEIVAQPSDVVLILDVSGSMKQDIFSTKKTSEVYKRVDTTRDDYYVRIGGGDSENYIPVTYWDAQGCWFYYDNNGQSHKADYAVSGYGMINSEGIELHDFYELSHDENGKSVYTPYVQYVIKLDNGRIAEVKGINWNNGKNDWYYQNEDGSTNMDVEPKQGVKGSKKQYEFFEGIPKKKINVLRESASMFIDNLAKKSKKSKVDIISFSDSVTNETNGFKDLDTQPKVDEIKGVINALQPRSVTRTDLGMAEAVKALDPIKNNGRKKIVVLLTDGRPEGSDSGGAIAMDTLIAAAENSARTLKSSPTKAVLYSIGIFNEQDFSEKKVQDFMRNVATPKDNSVQPPKDYFFNCSEATDLDKIFNEISSETGTSLEKCKIKDYIDPKFIITQESIKELRAMGATVTTEIKGGVTYQVVIWTETIKPGTEGFKGTIIIKPKDASVYGKDLPTNINGISAVYDKTGNNIGSFPLPTVDIINLAQELNQEKTSTKVEISNNLNRSYKITLKAWTSLENVRVYDDVGITNYELSGLKNITIKDYLDPRFEPTVEWLASIKGQPNVEANQDTSGNWYIQWNNQFIPYIEAGNTSINKWSKDIIIKAKDKFIGGNDIPTNIALDSAIYKGNVILKEFSKPTVNVPVNLSIIDKQESIFFGEKFPVDGVKEEMFTQGNPNCFLGKEPTGTFNYQWFESDGVTTINDLNEKASLSLNKDLNYKLRVTFTPKSTGTISEGTSGGIKVEETYVVGQYDIKVVSGQITVNKTIDTKDIWFPHGDPIFNFKLERLDANEQTIETLYDVIRFEEGNNIYDGTTATKYITFNGLKKGKYRLTELDTLRYKFESNSVDTSKSCKAETYGQAMNFYMGYEDKGNSTTNLKNREGMGTFINKKGNEKYFSHTDVVKNTFVLK
ncbi:MAG: vWA domain-containing protein [Clostridium sp.]